MPPTPFTCICCGFQSFTEQPLLKEDAKLRICNNCHTGMTFPAPHPEELEEHYTSSYYGENNVKFISPLEKMVQGATFRRAWWIHKFIPAQGRVLDIGCGRGLLLKYLNKLRHPAFGVERSELAATRALKTEGITIYTQPFSECQIETASFDAIIIWHVLEHLENPSETLNKIFRLLKPSGFLFLEVPNFKSWQSILTGKYWFHLDFERHFFHFTRKGLKKLIEDKGFVIYKQRTFSYEQSPYGFLQSVMNQMTCQPEFLYKLLKKEISTSFFKKIFYLLIAGLMLPVAIILSALESFAGQGGVLRVVCGKREDGRGKREEGSRKK